MGPLGIPDSKSPNVPRDQTVAEFVRGEKGGVMGSPPSLRRGLPCSGGNVNILHSFVIFYFLRS